MLATSSDAFRTLVSRIKWHSMTCRALCISPWPPGDVTNTSAHDAAFDEARQSGGEGSEWQLAVITDPASQTGNVFYNIDGENNGENINNDGDDDGRA